MPTTAAVLDYSPRPYWEGSSAFSSDFENLKTMRNQAMSETLDALQPMPLLPCRLGKCQSQAVAVLKQVAFVDIRKAKSGYSVSVYHCDPTSRIPIHGLYARNQQSIHERRRVYTVHVAFKDFLLLRYDAYELARSSHLFHGCSFCDRMLVLNSVSDVKPRWSVHWFKPKHQKCAMLTAYLNEMLHIVQQEPTNCDDRCRGQERLPRLLQMFLWLSELQRRNL